MEEGDDEEETPTELRRLLELVRDLLPQEEKKEPEGAKPIRWKIWRRSGTYLFLWL